MRSRPKTKSDIQPWSLCFAELEDRIDDPTIKFRRTPPGQPTVPDLVQAEDMVRTSYNSGPYIVLKIKEHTTKHCGREYLSHKLHCVHEKHWRGGDQNATAWIGELVAVNGRILKLYEANTDEVFVTQKNVKPIPLRQTTLIELIERARKNG